MQDDSAGGLVVSKVLSTNLNFSFLNRIFQLLSSSYPILFSRGWVDPVPDLIRPEKSRVLPGIELVTSWMTDVLISILKGRSFFLNKCSNENENDK